LTAAVPVVPLGAPLLDHDFLLEAFHALQTTQVRLGHHVAPEASDHPVSVRGNVFHFDSAVETSAASSGWRTA